MVTVICKHGSKLEFILWFLSNQSKFYMCCMQSFFGHRGCIVISSTGIKCLEKERNASVHLISASDFFNCYSIHPLKITNRLQLVFFRSISILSILSFLFLSFFLIFSSASCCCSLQPFFKISLHTFFLCAQVN